MSFSSNSGTYTEPSIAKRNKCASCGADLVFDAKSNSLYCQHCESKFAISNEPFSDKKVFSPNELAEETINKEMHTIKCLNCGASEEITNLTISTI